MSTIVLPEKIENISVGDLITLTTDNRKYILIDDYKSNGSYKLTSIDYHQDRYIEQSDLKPLLKKHLYVMHAKLYNTSSHLTLIYLSCSTIHSQEKYMTLN